MGTSCPDHFLRTRICPLFIPWNPAVEGLAELRAHIEKRIAQYREDYADYYNSCALAGFAQASRYQSIRGGHSGAGRFRIREGQAGSPHHHGVFRERDSRDGRGERPGGSRLDCDCRFAASPASRAGGEFSSFHNYVALPQDARRFRIEYWALEEAKLQRMPPEREFSRRIFLVVGGGSGIGREVSLQTGSKRRARCGRGSRPGSRGIGRRRSRCV